MIRRILASLALAALLAAPPAPSQAWLAQKGGGIVVTPTSLVLMGKGLAATSTTSDRFFPVAFPASGTTTAQKSTLMPVAGTMTSLRFFAPTAPTGAQTWVATLYKNGSSTGQTCTVTSSSSPAGICTSSTGVSFAAADYADLLVHPTGTPNSSFVAASFVFTPTVANDTVIVGIGSAFSTSAVNAAHPFANAAASTAASRRISPLPDGGTIDKLQILTVAPGTAASGKAYDFSPGKNGTATAVTCNALEVATTCSDGTNSFSVAAQDDIQLQASPTNTPTTATASFGFRYVPTTAGSFPLMAVGQGTNNSTSTPIYFPVAGGGSAGSATESNVQNIADSMTITKLVAKLTAPGLAASGKKHTVTLRVNGVDTALTCDVIEVATTCTATGTVSVNNNDLLSIGDTPTGTPAAGAPGFGLLAHR